MVCEQVRYGESGKGIIREVGGFDHRSGCHNTILHVAAAQSSRKSESLDARGIFAVRSD
jgi:hypothetical protein